MNNIKNLRIGIIPSSFDPLMPTSRLRGYFVQEALKEKGLQCFIVDAKGAFHCDLVIISRKYERDWLAADVRLINELN